MDEISAKSVNAIFDRSCYDYRIKICHFFFILLTKLFYCSQSILALIIVYDYDTHVTSCQLFAWEQSEWNWMILLFLPCTTTKSICMACAISKSVGYARAQHLPAIRIAPKSLSAPLSISSSIHCQFYLSPASASTPPLFLNSSSPSSPLFSHLLHTLFLIFVISMRCRPVARATRIHTMYALYGSIRIGMNETL